MRRYRFLDDDDDDNHHPAPLVFFGRNRRSSEAINFSLGRNDDARVLLLTFRDSFDAFRCVPRSSDGRSSVVPSPAAADSGAEGGGGGGGGSGTFDEGLGSENLEIVYSRNFVLFFLEAFFA